MLLFPILLLLLAIQLVVSPILLWAAVPSRWHLTLALVYAAIAIIVVAFWIRDFARERIALRKNPAASAHWRWSPRMKPEMFRRAIELFLSMRGWHVLSSSIVAEGRVELIVQKDRWTLALLFISPRHPGATAEDAAYLHAVCDESYASFAALVTASPCAPDTLAAAARTNLMLLRFGDIPRLDEVLSFASSR